MSQDLFQQTLNISYRLFWKSGYVKSNGIEWSLPNWNTVNVTDKIKNKHDHESTCSVKCPKKSCLQSYKGEFGRRLIKRLNDHSGKDVNSYMLKHSIEANHPTMTLNNFTVLSSGYRNRQLKKKVSESLFIKSNRPTLNKHDTWVYLKVFK